jgi:hypothetical protein
VPENGGLPDPYDDRYEEILEALRQLSPAEQLVILQRIGIVGPDGKLAPAYAPEDEAVQPPRGC